MRWLSLLVLGCLASGCPASLDRYSVGDDDAAVTPDGAPRPTRCDDPIVVGSGYSEGFEAGPSGWGTQGMASSWAWGVPSPDADLNVAFEGTSAWVTNLEGDYGNNEESALISPCFDASSAGSDLLLTFGHWFETESGFDDTWLELTTDGGARWTKVPTDANTVNGYNDAGDEAWNGSSMGWRQASFRLPGTAGQTQIRVRFVLTTDSSSTRDGIGIDDVHIRPEARDLAVTAIEEGSVCGESVATITNVGGALVERFDVVRIVDGVEDRETISMPFRHRESVQLAASASGSTGVLVRVELDGDVDASNDEMRYVYSPIDASAGMMWLFESNAGDFQVGGNNASWAWGRPRGPFIGGAESGQFAWVTNPDGEYNHNEMSFLRSPCMDLSGTARDPMLRFALIYATESCCDEGWVELSVGGGPFVKLGEMSDGWYTNRAGYWNGMSGEPNGWMDVSHPLTGAAGMDDVRFRFVFSSDGSVANDGFGIDDVFIEP